MILIMLYQWVNNRNIRQSQGVNMKKKFVSNMIALTTKIENRKEKFEKDGVVDLKDWYSLY